MPLFSKSARHTALAWVVAAFGSACASANPAPADAPDVTGPADTPVAAASSVATFTTEQAAIGQGAFSSLCSDCHSISEFRGSDFQYRFRRRTAWNLYTIVSETMPEDSPGALPAETYVAIIAYVLQLNGYEAGGTALTPTEATLRQLPLDEVPSSPSGL